MKFKTLCAWLPASAAVLLLLCGSASHYEFDLPELYGCRSSGLNPAELRFLRTADASGNGCATLETTGNGTLARDAAIQIGVTRTIPGTRLDYELAIRGNLAGAMLRPVAWRGTETPKPVAKTPLQPDEKWQTLRGDFRVPEGAEFIALELFLPTGTRLTPGASLQVDNVRIANEAGVNLYTHLTFVETAATAATLPKKSGDYVILFKGNSITRHGVDDDTIRRLGWDHVAGMAASAEKFDYAHLLCDKIAAALPGRTVRPVFGRGNQGALDDLAHEKTFRPDLIVLQGGEHNTSETEIAQYRAYLLKTIAALRAFPGAPPLILVGIWDAHDGDAYPPDSRAGRVLAIQRQVSAETGVPLVSVETFAGDPACRGWGTHDGVKWHPNDLGMKKYAEAIFNVWKTLPSR